MKDVAVYEAKTRLSELLVEVEQGEQFTITRRGLPVAQLISVRSGAALSDGMAAGPAAAASRQRQQVAAAFAALAQLAQGVSLDLPLRDAISNGRD